MLVGDVNNNSYGGNVMSDRYIPKVGDTFEWETLGGWKRETEVVFETEKQIAVIDPSGFIDLISKDIEFRPIPTKADVEREQLCELLEDSCAYVPNEGLAEEIQRLGFTIPKKVKRSDVSETVSHCLQGQNISTTAHRLLVKDLFTLLGDLVEDEA